MHVTALRRASTSLVAPLAVLLAVLLAATIGAVVGTTPAHAVVDEPPRPAFYAAPAALPSGNGTVIRSERMSFLLDPLDATSLVRNAQRVLYTTTNRRGA